MKRTFLAGCLAGLALLLNSCFKEDERVAPHNSGNVHTDTLPMTQNYKYRVYFDLASGHIAGNSLKKECDMGFECSSGGWHIILNTSDFMKAADMGVRPFGQAQDTAGLAWKFDKSDGNPDSNAVGCWFQVTGADTVSNGHVYAIDRGLDENGQPLGMFQVVFDSLKNGSYYFRTAGMNGSDPHSHRVAKDATVNYMFFSVAGDGAVKPIEPPKTGYDLLFTQYTTLLFTDLGEAYPYLVTGVLLNPFQTAAARDTLHAFGEITYEIAAQMTFDTTLDYIGYDWKSYDFETGAYTVRPGINYIIRDSDGFYFKMRFIGFYNSLGEKGYPVIEYQQL